MKTNEFLNYEAPQVEIVEVEVEKGFAASFAASGDPNDIFNGGDVSTPQ